MRSIDSTLPAQSREAMRFYEKLGEKIRLRKIVIDSFLFNVDSMGLTEMLPCLKITGGLLIQHEEFDSDIFRQSFQKAYSSVNGEAEMELGTDVEVQVKMSSEIEMNGFQNVKKEKLKKHIGRFKLQNVSDSTTVTISF